MNFNNQYLDNKFNIDIINNNKFTIFKIPNFLNEENYELLNTYFPKIESKTLNEFNLKKNNLKYRISSNENNYQDIINKNSVLMDFHNEIFSFKFFNYFFKNLKKYFIQSRISDPRYLVKLFKPKTFIESKSLFKTYIKRQIEFSYILDGGRIVPHTDARSKLLSLMLYFPNYKENNNHYYKEKTLGTVFWKSNLKNLNNNHLTNFSDELNFKERSKNLTKIPFEKFHLYGFIRNKYSWHSVDSIDMGEKYIRRSININFNF
jgi:hypothetical protein